MHSLPAHHLVLAMLTLALVAAQAPAARADMLVAPQTLSTLNVGAPSAAMTSNGYAFVVWSAGFQNGPIQSVPSTVVGAWRSPGGSFGPAFVVGTQLIVSDVVAAGSEGVVIAGRDPRGAIVKLLATRATRGHDQVLAPDPADLGERAGSLRLAADAAGNVLAALHKADESVVAFSRPPGGLFGPGEVIADSRVLRVVTDMNSAGDAVIVANRYFGEITAWVRRAGDSVFGAPQDTGILGAGGMSLDVAMTPNGDVGIVDHASRPGVIFAPNFAFLPAGGTFAAPQPTGSAWTAVVAGAGSTVSVASVDGATNTARLADRRPDGLLGPSQLIGPGPICDQLGADTVTSAGNMAIIYRTPCQAGPITPGVTPGSLVLVERPAGGLPSRPLRLGPPDAAFPAVASNGSGSIVVAWRTDLRNPAQRRVQAIVRDGPAELALLGLGRTLRVRNGRASISLGCAGLRDCSGSLTLKRIGTRAPKAHVTVGVAVTRGTARTTRVRLPRGAVRGKRPRLRVTVTLVDRGRVLLRRSQTVVVKRH